MGLLPIFRIMKIYRYRTISTTSFDEIINGELWYSKLSELNDPFEGFYIKNQKNKSFECFMGSLLVCCFSRVPDSLLMWAHYSDSHRGICLEYEITEEDFKTTFMEVNYSDIMPKIDSIKTYPADHPSADCLSINIHNEGKAFTTKSKDWSYEKELRTFRILEDHKLKGEISKFPGTLTKILFGLRTTDREIATMDRILVSNPGLMFQRADLKEDSYEIKFDAVDRTRI